MLTSGNRPRLEVKISPQPDDTTCGPTCLEAIYRYYGSNISLGETIAQVPAFAEGGTLAVQLGCHALDNGFPVTLYSYNLRIFDPTWFDLPPDELELKLRLRMQYYSGGKKRRTAMSAYRQFLSKGGRIAFSDLTPELLVTCLGSDQPILAGLSATWLYRGCRELGATCGDDDIRGDPVGHFVVLAGFDRKTRQVDVADPYMKNPLSSHYYSVDMGRLITAILLGVLTYDANLLIIHPPK